MFERARTVKAGGRKQSEIRGGRKSAHFMGHMRESEPRIGLLMNGGDLEAPEQAFCSCMAQG